MHKLNRFIGTFPCGYSDYTPKDISYYRQIFDFLYPSKPYVATMFYKRVDDFAYAGRHERWGKDGRLCCTDFFIVRVGDRVGVVDSIFKILIPLEYKEIIPPTHFKDSVFVVKNCSDQWGVIDAINNEIIVPFGKFLKIWGYDNHHALVCTNYENSYNNTTNRAIIDTKGRVVRGTDTYSTIYPFYGTNSTYILVETKPAGTDKYGFREHYFKLLSKEFPEKWDNLSIDTVKGEATYYCKDDDYPVYDKMDAYEDDYGALWNTD